MMIRMASVDVQKEVNQLLNDIIKRNSNKEPNSGELIRFYRYASIKQVIG